MSRIAFLVWVGGFALSLAGCKPGAPPTAKVTGTVTYSGKPVNTGRITFFDPTGHPELGDIGPDGNYTVQARLGANKVAIYAHEPDVPNPKGRPVTLPGKSLVPEKYENPRTSELTAEVKSGDNKADFVLK